MSRQVTIYIAGYRCWNENVRNDVFDPEKPIFCVPRSRLYHLGRMHSWTFCCWRQWGVNKLFLWIRCKFCVMCWYCWYCCGHCECWKLKNFLSQATSHCKRCSLASALETIQCLTHKWKSFRKQKKHQTPQLKLFSWQMFKLSMMESCQMDS